MKQKLRHTSPFLKAVVGRVLLTSSRAPTIQSRRGHQCGVSEGSALRLRLTGSVVQTLTCYDLLSYKAIDSNYFSFVVASMLVSTSPLDEAGTATTSSVRRIFKKRRPENLKIMKTKSKISPLKFSPVFGPKLGEDQKKDLHPDSVLFVCSNFLPKLQRKGPWHHAPPLNTSLSIIIISLG